MASDEPDASAQAAAANRFAATAYVGFESHPGAEPIVHFYRVPHFESAGGRALAERIALAWAQVPGVPVPAVRGMRLAVLRETRMPAVLLTVGSVQATLDHASDVVEAIVTALESWAREPLLSPGSDDVTA